MEGLLGVIAILQTQIDALKALAVPTPQFSQADVDAAKAAGIAQGLAQAASVLGADLAKLTSDVAGLSPAAPQS